MDEIEVRDQLLAADDTVSASSSGMPEMHDDSSGNMLISGSSELYRKTTSQGNEAKTDAEEPDFHNKMNLSSARKSAVLSCPVDATPVQCLTDRETARMDGERDDVCCSQQSHVQQLEHQGQQICSPLSVRECANESGLPQSQVKKPLSTIRKPEYLSNEEDPFEYSPPRKVRLKYRDNSSACADVAGQKIQPASDVISSPTNPRRNSNSPSNSDQCKQPTSCTVEKHSKTDKKPPLLGHSPSAFKHSLQPLTSRSVKRKTIDNDKSLLGPYQGSSAENEHDVDKFSKKPLLQLDEQKREFSEPDRSSLPHCRGSSSGQRSRPRSLAKDLTGGRLKQERLPLLKSNDDVLKARFERESRIKNEPLWRQRNEEVLWQERDRVSWRREEEQQERGEYSNRHEPEALRQERFPDLRQKLDARRQYTDWQRRDKEYTSRRETYRPLLSDDQPVNCRPPLLPSPRRRPQCDEDEFYEVDDFRCDSQRRNDNCLLADLPCQLPDDDFLQEDDRDSWMNANRRRWKQSSEYSDVTVKEEPYCDWHREVRQYFSLPEC